jgi:multidrug efflux pump subunit AcrA (membrane-fusion protein)
VTLYVILICAGIALGVFLCAMIADAEGSMSGSELGGLGIIVSMAGLLVVAIVAVFDRPAAPPDPNAPPPTRQVIIVTPTQPPEIVVATATPEPQYVIVTVTPKEE